jgi:hypothetical protein
VVRKHRVQYKNTAFSTRTRAFNSSNSLPKSRIAWSANTTGSVVIVGTLGVKWLDIIGEHMAFKKRKRRSKSKARRRNRARVSSLTPRRRKVKASAKRRSKNARPRRRNLFGFGGAKPRRRKKKAGKLLGFSCHNPRRKKRPRTVTVSDRKVAAQLVKVMRRMGYKARLVSK